MRATLATVKASRIPKNLSICPDDPRLLEFVNEAQQTLLNQGNWWGTVMKAIFCLNAGCITWPREVAVVLGLKICGRVLPIRNGWFEWLANAGDITSAHNAYHHNHDYLQALEASFGLACTFADITGVTSVVRVYPSTQSDVGKQILIQGFDQNNIAIRTNYGGNFVDGEYVTLAWPYADTVSIYSSITGVQKAPTDAIIRLYAHDTVTGSDIALAIYQPDETLPTYRRSHLNGLLQTCHHNETPPLTCNHNVTVEALVKLAFVPVARDEDWLLIGNIPALKDMCMSIDLEEKGDSQRAAILKNAAIAKLNHELRTMTNYQTSIAVPPHGSAGLRRIMGNFR